MMRFSALATLAVTDVAVGFAVQTVVLVTVGVGASTDGYYAGQAPMLVLLAVFQLPLQRAVVAAFADNQSGRYPAARLLVFVIVSMACFIGLLMVAAPGVIRLVYWELSAEARQIALDVLRVQGMAVVLTAGNIVLISLNHVSGRFIQCEVALATSAVIAGGCVILAVGRYGVLAPAYGQVLKAFLAGAICLWLLRGKLSWRPPPWKHIWNIVRPLSLAGALSKLAPLVDRSIASGAASGSLTVLVFTKLCTAPAWE